MPTPHPATLTERPDGGLDGQALGHNLGLLRLPLGFRGPLAFGLLLALLGFRHQLALADPEK